MFVYCMKMISQFIEDMKRQKLRCVLTMSGITWGTMAVILLLAFGESMREASMNAMSGMGSNIVVMGSGRTTKTYQGLPAGRPIRLRLDTAEYLRQQIPEIGEVSPEVQDYFTLIAGQVRQQYNGVGVIPEYGTMRKLPPEPGGRFINTLDVEQHRRVIFIGNEVRDKLYGAGTDPVGETMFIRGTPFLVVGVLEDKLQNNSYMTQDANIVFMPFTTCIDITGASSLNRIILRARTFGETPRMMDQVYEVLGPRYGFATDDTDAVWMWDTSESTIFLDAFFKGFESFLLLSGIFTLIVGGIGVANIMYVSIRERRREIGVKSALGATPGLIQLQFLLEAAIIMLVGGGMGVTGAILVVSLFRTPLLAPVTDMIGKPQIDLTIALITVTILSLIGFTAGWSPAKRASEMDPVRALEF